MQLEEHTPSNTPLQDPSIPHIAINDTNWLQNITLTSSDYSHPPPKLNSSLFPPANLTDEAAALEAHLWDRQHASDLSAYEWDSSDLVSSIHSNDACASDEEQLPRLARRDEFEQGIRREETWSRAYRERWEEPGLFYKRKLGLRLEAEEREYKEGRSFVSDDGWGGQDEQGWDTPASSGGEGLDVGSRSAQGWSGEGGWDSWEKDGLGVWIAPKCPLNQGEDGMEEPEASNRLESPLAQEMDDTTQEQGCEETDDHPGEPSLQTQKPSRIPIPKKSSFSIPKPSRIPIPKISTYNQTHSSPIQYQPTTTLPYALHTARRKTISDPTTHASTPPTVKPSQSILTPTTSDPNPIAYPVPSTPSPPLSPTTLNARLNASIFKSLTLLAAAHQALHSAANIGNTPHSPISGSPEFEIGGERDRENYTRREMEMVNDTSIEQKIQNNPYKPNNHPPRSDKNTVVPATDIVRVEGWWKVRGRERWRMVGRRDSEEKEEDEKAIEYEYWN